MGRQAKDYGSRQISWTERVLRMVGLPMLGLAVLWLLVDWTTKWTAHEASTKRVAADWTIEGPACPAAGPGPSKSRYLMTFHGVEFGRRFGHAECAFIRGPAGHGPVCQFTSPADLEVRTEGGVFRYAPGIGQPATISVIGEAPPSCVMATRFELGRVMVGKSGPGLLP
jgi:hypothetical protein